MIEETHIVPVGTSNIRLYDYCLNLFNQLPSRKSVKKAIDRGEIKVNGESSSTGYWMQGTEQISYQRTLKKGPKEYQLKLKVVFEDEYIAIIHKPAGIVVSGNQFKTILNALSFNLSASKEADALDWPLPVHRLDKATSGLLIVAKTKKARIKLGQDFENKKIQKEYHALVMGKMPDKGQINLSIEEKTSFTEYICLKTTKSLRSEFLSLVKLIPKTGRTHQLRIHLSKSGFPILGDQLYGPKNNTLKHKGLFLFASKLCFDHPSLKRPLIFEIPLPKKYENRMKSEERRWNMYRTV